MHLRSVSISSSGLLRYSAAGIALFGGLVAVSRHNYLLFHGLAELFSIAVAWGVFMLVWNTRRYLDNDALVCLGVAYFFVGLIDLFHMLAYKGMGVFPDMMAANRATQLWIAARYLESVSLLVFPLLMDRYLRVGEIFWFYAMLTVWVFAAIFAWQVFPDCYVDGGGLTAFKRLSEYLICLILAGAVGLLWRMRCHFDGITLRLLFAAIGATIAGEMAFTVYISVYGISNLIGHFFKIISFLFIYLALIRSGVSRPIDVLLDQYKRREADLNRSKGQWEAFSTHFKSPLVVVETGGRVVSVNPAGARLVGLSRHEIVGKRFVDVFPGDFAAIISRQLAKLAVNPQPVVGERTVTLAGVIKTFQTVWFPVQTAESSSSLFGGMAFDITEQKQSERDRFDFEQKFKTVFHHTPLMMVISSIDDGTLLDVNEIFTRITGYTREEAVGITSGELGLLAPEDRRCLIQRLTDEGRVVATATNFWKKNGDAIECMLWMEIVGAGGQQHLLTIASDVTEQNLLESELRWSEAFFRSVFEGSRDAIFIADVDGAFLMINPAAELLSGYSGDELSLLTTADIFSNFSLPSGDRSVDRVLSGESILVMDKILRKDGVARDIELGLQQIVVDRVPAIHISVRDITERKLAMDFQSFRRRFGDMSALRSIPEMLTEFLDESERLTDSRVSFLHDVESDTSNVSLKIWSTRTLKNCCLNDCNMHNSLSQTGAWTDCLRKRQPLVVNDYASLISGRRVPTGHVPIERMLTVPISYNGKIVAIFGVGNKPKDYTSNDVRLVSELADMAWDIVCRKRFDQALHSLKITMEHVTETIIITDDHGIIQYVNPAFERNLGYTGNEVIGQSAQIIQSDMHDEAFYANLKRTLKMGKRWTDRVIIKRKDGQTQTDDVSITPVHDASGTLVNYISVHRDVTDKLRMEEQLLQAQKMEAIGALSGGIAHDFNNILFPMIGFAELLQDELAPGSDELDYVEEILIGAKRARELVQQILLFSRQKEYEKKPIRLQLLLKEVLKLTRSTLPSTIEIAQNIDAGCPTIFADFTQIHQVVMNLITNAFHAMEATGGRLTISLHEIETGPDGPEHGLPPERRYVRLIVSDTGCGIDATVIDRIFEPFFTTKPREKGTGMGLSVVHGILKNHDGSIHVESEFNRGTSVYVYLPCHGGSVEIDTPNEEPPDGGNEHILIVDDEPSIIRFSQLMLEGLGYRVTTRLSSVEALELFKKRANRFDLVITDLTMPVMTGEALSREIKSLSPETPILMCTGFSQKVNHEKLRAIGVDGVILKPILKRDIAQKIRNILDSKKSSS